MESVKVLYFKEDVMSTRKENARQFARHLAMGLLVNVTVAPLLAGIYLFGTPTLKLAAGLGALLSFEVWAFVIKRMKRTWTNARPLGYYFLPTAIMLWALDRQHRKPKAKPEISRLKEIVATWPDASIRAITGILDPKQQQRTLTIMINEMDGMRDSRLATLTDRIHQYLGRILESVSENENYILFGQIMSRLSSYGPDRHQQTYRSFLRLLTGVFEPARSGDPRRQFQKHMTGPLKRAIEHAGKTHAAGIQQIVSRIMADGLNEHQTAGSVAEMLLLLDWSRQREICRILFDEGLKRAFLFPREFGAEFLNMLGKLEHRVFWLDVRSLQTIIQESLSQIEEGLINSNLSLYNELCSKVFAPIEDPACHGVRHARVFRRLKDDDGRVKIDCVCSDKKPCSCEGQSLSFRGIYSKSCRKDAGEKLAMSFIPIREVEHRFAVKASIAPLHAYESGSHGPGRGAFFDDAEPSVVRGLYEYVSTKP
jgi:hypothetical protein